jgi:hypothetical protein
MLTATLTVLSIRLRAVKINYWWTLYFKTVRWAVNINY